MGLVGIPLDIMTITIAAIASWFVNEKNKPQYVALPLESDSFIIVTGCAAQLKPDFFQNMDAVNLVLGNKEKQWFISRTQSYHGATTDCMAIGERPNLDFYSALFPLKRAKITEHNKYRHMLEGETEEEYGIRSAKELENLILKIGPEKVCAFVGETIMGGLVGDVPPTANYWMEIRNVCNKYNVHLILDEVWCGCGVSGKNFCIDWDNISPDFIFLGKTFAAGYLPLSAVVTSSSIEQIIKETSGRV